MDDNRDGLSNWFEYNIDNSGAPSSTPSHSNANNNTSGNEMNNQQQEIPPSTYYMSNTDDHTDTNIPPRSANDNTNPYLDEFVQQHQLHSSNSMANQQQRHQSHSNLQNLHSPHSHNLLHIHHIDNNNSHNDLSNFNNHYNQNYHHQQQYIEQSQQINTNSATVISSNMGSTRRSSLTFIAPSHNTNNQFNTSFQQHSNSSMLPPRSTIRSQNSSANTNDAVSTGTTNHDNVNINDVNDTKNSDSSWSNSAFEPIPLDCVPYTPYPTLSSLEQQQSQQHQTSHQQEQMQGVIPTSNTSQPQYPHQLPKRFSYPELQLQKPSLPQKPLLQQILIPQDSPSVLSPLLPPPQAPTASAAAAAAAISTIPSTSEREERQKFLVFIYALFKYIDKGSKSTNQNDHDNIKTQARQLVKECTGSSRLGIRGYSPLMHVIKKKLLTVKGIDIYWNLAQMHLDSFWSKKQNQKKLLKSEPQLNKLPKTSPKRVRKDDDHSSHKSSNNSDDMLGKDKGGAGDQSRSDSSTNCSDNSDSKKRRRGNRKDILQIMSI